MKINRTLALAVGAFGISALGFTGVAVAADGSAPAGTETSTSGGEGAADQAAQDAACEAAGVDLSASNIQYDDETGDCSLDGGGQDTDE